MTVFLFALTDAEAAQPRALFGGHLGGALIGILCFQLFGDALWVSVVALVLTMVFMVVTRTIHPPAGATPLIMVHHHANFMALLKPAGLGVLTIFFIAIIWSRLGQSGNLGSGLFCLQRGGRIRTWMSSD